MTWFFLLFPLGMVLAPLGVLLVPTRSTLEESRERTSVLTRRLAVATALAVTIVGATWTIWAFGDRDATSVRIVEGVMRGSWIAFFPLWFLLAMPLLAAKRPDLTDAPAPGGPKRAASLVARDRTPVLRPACWALGAVTLVVPIALVAWRASGAESAALIPWGLVVVGIATYAFVGLVSTFAGDGPEPLGSGDDHELTRDYERLRRFRAWLFFGLGLLLAHASLLLAVSFAWPFGNGAITIIATSLGVLGGVFGSVGGITASVLASRINRRLATERTTERGDDARGAIAR